MEKEGENSSKDLLSSCWNIVDLWYMSTVKKKKKDLLDKMQNWDPNT